MLVSFRPDFSLKPGAVNYLNPGMGIFVPVDDTINPGLTIRLPVVLPIHGSTNPRTKNAKW